jgi:hypothetical protein
MASLHGLLRRRFLVLLLLGSAILLASALAALAQALPAGWLAADIGEVGAVGRTRVSDQGVFTIQGSGRDIWLDADQFHFVYQALRGDGSILARLLSQVGGNEGWAKTGVMIREDESTGARYAMLDMTTGNGVDWQWRLDPDTGSYNHGAYLAPRELPVWMRIQRAGNEFAGFVSSDGRLWRSVTPSQPLVMRDRVLFGLAVTATSDGDISVARYDNVAIRPGELSVGGISRCVGDRRVLLQWAPLRGAAGYHVSRGSATAGLDGLARLTPAPVTTPSFTDAGPELTNGTPMTYAVVPVLRRADGTTTEGLPAAVQATPAAIPAGYVGCPINSRDGSAVFDPVTGSVTLRSFGGDTWGAADSCYFTGQLVEGNAQITATMLSKPSRTDDWAKAGVMIRESLDAGARNVVVGLTSGSGLWQQWRPVTGGGSGWPGAPTIPDADVRPPVVVRLTRRGNTITAEYSLDAGRSFRLAGDPYTFPDFLSRTVYFGLSLSAHDSGKGSEVRFSDVVVRRL